VVLLEPDGSFHAFGKDARSKYEALMEKDQHKDWFLFERFKMQLYNNDSVLFKPYRLLYTYVKQSLTKHKLK